MSIFWRQAIENSPEKFFQGLRMYYIVQNLDGIDQSYQSHQFIPDRIRRVETTNDANEERSHPVSRSVPPKKIAGVCLENPFARGTFGNDYFQ